MSSIIVAVWSREIWRTRDFGNALRDFAMLAVSGHRDEALAEHQAVRPRLVDTFGPDSVRVRSLDKQAAV